MIALKKLERYRNLTKNSMLVSPFAGTICDFDNQNQQNWINLVCFKATAMFGQHFGISLSRALRALRAIWTLHLTPSEQCCFRRLHVGDEIRGNVPGW